MTKHISDRDPYIRAEYLPEAGAAFTIRGWDTETIRQPDNSKRNLPIIVFSTGKKMIVNVTSLRMLAALFNDDEQASIGQAILLKPGKTNGKRTVIIAGRANGVAPAAARPEPSPDDDFMAGIDDQLEDHVAAIVNAATGAGLIPQKPATPPPHPLPSVAHPGSKEYKAACDAIGLPQLARNDLLRKHGGSYEDAIAELNSAKNPAAA